jgi:hypothetical protein
MMRDARALDVFLAEMHRADAIQAVRRCVTESEAAAVLARFRAVADDEGDDARALQ